MQQLDGCSLKGMSYCSVIDRGIESKFCSGTGAASWVCAKRLERGRFSWPSAGDESDRVMLSHEELSLLLGGIDLTRTRRKNWYRKELELSEKYEENTIKNALFPIGYYI